MDNDADRDYGGAPACQVLSAGTRVYLERLIGRLGPVMSSDEIIRAALIMYNDHVDARLEQLTDSITPDRVELAPPDPVHPQEGA